MERKLFSVLFFIKRTKLRKNGEAPIVVRITYDKQMVESQIGRSVPINQWSQNKGGVIGKDKKCNELNAYIEMVRIKIYNIQQDFERNGILYTAPMIKDSYMGRGTDQRTLYSTFSEHNAKCRELIGIDYELITIRRYDNCLKYLMETVKRQHGKDDVLLSEVNAELVRNFEHFLKVERGCAQNTVIRYMKCFKKIINLAINNEWMHRNPFAGIKFHEQVINKDFLSQDEVTKLIQTDFGIEKLNLVRDIFAFQIFTGLAYVDVLNLRPEHILTDAKGKIWIHKARQKTDNMCYIPLLQFPIMILEKYAEYPECLQKGTLLPVYQNQTMNAYLKQIASICGISKVLTTHTARRTFATVIALANNVSLANVSKMLGHTTVRMTQRYAKVLDSSIMRDMESVENSLLINNMEV